MEVDQCAPYDFSGDLKGKSYGKPIIMLHREREKCKFNVATGSKAFLITPVANSALNLVLHFNQ